MPTLLPSRMPSCSTHTDRLEPCEFNGDVQEVVDDCQQGHYHPACSCQDEKAFLQRHLRSTRWCVPSGSFCLSRRTHCRSFPSSILTPVALTNMYHYATSADKFFASISLPEGENTYLLPL